MANLSEILDRLTQGISLSTLIAGEDLTNNVLKTEQRFSNALVTMQSLTTIKSGSGFVHSINFAFSSCPTLTLYDNTAGSGTVLHRFPAGYPQGSYILDYSFTTGLTIDAVTVGQSPTVEISYR